MMKNNKRDEVISIAQAQAFLCGAAKPVGSEVLAPEESLGRILAQDEARILPGQVWKTLSACRWRESCMQGTHRFLREACTVVRRCEL